MLAKDLGGHSHGTSDASACYYLTMSIPLVASGPYIGELDDTKKKQEPIEILQIAKSKLTVISVSTQAKKSLES